MTAGSLVKAEIKALIQGTHGAPRHVLGPHPLPDNKTLVRAYRPGAVNARLIIAGEEIPMRRVDPAGVFEATIERQGQYQIATDYADGRKTVAYDPYQFGTLLGELDYHLFSEGTHLRAYDHLGAHPRIAGGVEGVHFAVWAPNARRVSVVGDFNDWNTTANPLERGGDSGIWELFVPGVSEGARYKFSLLPNAGGPPIEKSDPYAFAFEVRPRSASVVVKSSTYRWADAVWLDLRPVRQALDAPLAIYEVHLGSWRRSDNPDAPFLNYRDLGNQLVDHVKKHNFTHVELMPIAEHPLDESWGYQVIGYFAPTSRFGTPDDFRWFVDHLHQNGIGVILDWVPAHFPKDGHGLSLFDGTHLYDHLDPRQGEHPDWGTLVFNFGRSEVRSFLLSNALYWLEQFHIDGLRVDAVASMLYLDYSRRHGEWIPNRYGGNENIEAIQFLKQFNEILHRDFPGVLTVAEESTAWPMVSRPTYFGGLGFTLKWNMGWMHDTLVYFQHDPLFRRYHQGALTFPLIYAFSENFVLPLSHDEVVHGKGSLVGKMPGDWWQQFANFRLLLGLQIASPGKKLLFMGSEIGQWTEWSEGRAIEWELLEWPMHRSVSRFVSDLNRLYVSEPSLHQVDFSPAGFEWIDFQDVEQSVVAFLRRARDPDDLILFVFNFTPQPRHGYRVGVPMPGRYLELLNSDSEVYGGSNVGNLGAVTSEPVPFHGQEWSVRLTLPPLGLIALKPA